MSTEPNLDHRLAELEHEYDAVEAELADPATGSDPNRLRDLSRRHHELGEIVAAWRSLGQVRSDLAIAREMLEESAGEDRQILHDEVASAETSIAELGKRLGALLQPKDPHDGRSVIMEIRGAEGGEEANLFARDLFEMYSRYAGRRGWKIEVLSESPSERDGLNEVVFVVKGADAWSRLASEGGTHRVQRVPVTEAKGRVHTSAATVTVLPEVDDVEVSIDPSDLRIDVFRSTGPGGQSVNTTDSAVRITHLPTGIVVSMQDEKSQIKNRAKAMTVLRARVRKAEEERRDLELSIQRRSQVGGGGRSEKVRTYNFRENRVTDHRIALTLHKLDQILAGDLDQLTDALLADRRSQQLVNDA